MDDLSSSTVEVRREASGSIIDTLDEVSQTITLTNEVVVEARKYLKYKQRLDSANKEYMMLNQEDRKPLQLMNSENTKNCKQISTLLLKQKQTYEIFYKEIKNKINIEPKPTDDFMKALLNLDRLIKNVITLIHRTHTYISKTCDDESFINTMKQAAPPPLDKEQTRNTRIKVDNLLNGTPPVPTHAQPEPIVKQLSTPTPTPVPVPVPKKTHSSTSDMPNEYLIMYLFEMIGLLLSKDDKNVDFQNAIQKHVTFEPHAAIPTAIFESIKGIKGIQGSTSQQPLDKSSRMALSYLVIQHVKRNR
jgi:hypothetical protein